MILLGALKPGHYLRLKFGFEGAGGSILTKRGIVWTSLPVKATEKVPISSTRQRSVGGRIIMSISRAEVSKVYTNQAWHSLVLSSSKSHGKVLRVGLHTIHSTKKRGQARVDYY